MSLTASPPPCLSSFSPPLHPRPSRGPGSRRSLPGRGRAEQGGDLVPRQQGRHRVRVVPAHLPRRVQGVGQVRGQAHQGLAVLRQGDRRGAQEEPDQRGLAVRGQLPGQDLRHGHQDPQCLDPGAVRPRGAVLPQEAAQRTSRWVAISFSLVFPCVYEIGPGGICGLRYHFLVSFLFPFLRFIFGPGVICGFVRLI